MKPLTHCCCDACLTCEAQCAAIGDLTKALEWALDLLDMYDKRLASVDGKDRVYTEVHVRAKSNARGLLQRGSGE